MTMRINPSTGDSVSILGYGFMRLPEITDASGEKIIDQEQVDRLVDHAMKHGINYYDTSPVYCKGNSEHSLGIALSRYPRDSYFIATKMSNFAPKTWPREESIKMYRNSLKELRTDYIDYMLLHAIGQGGMEAWENRYINNGILDFLIGERSAGKIKISASHITVKSRCSTTCLKCTTTDCQMGFRADTAQLPRLETCQTVEYAKHGCRISL